MKKQTRLLSLLISGVMTATLFSPYVSEIAVPAYAEDSKKTDLTIDFDQSAVSPEEARSQLYQNNCEKYAWIQQDYDKICWKPALYWTCNNDPDYWSYWIKYQIPSVGNNTKVDPVDGSSFNIKDAATARKFFNLHVQPYSIRTLLESDDDDDTYIALAADDTHSERQRD